MKIYPPHQLNESTFVILFILFCYLLLQNAKTPMYLQLNQLFETSPERCVVFDQKGTSQFTH